jgi:hypothetical protein
MTMVFITPRDDRETKVAAASADRAMAEVNGVGCSSNDRDEVTAVVGRHEHVAFFGHGTTDALIARRGLFRRWVELLDVENLARDGRVVIAVACFSARELGCSLTDGPSPLVTAYIGWRDAISCPPTQPEPIWRAVVEGFRVLASGRPLEEAVATMEEGFSAATAAYEDQMPDNVLARMQSAFWRSQMSPSGDLSATI